MKRTKKYKKSKKYKNTVKVYNRNDFNSGNGMLTSVWGPSLWHFLHTMSFNYPIKPTNEDKKNFSKFIINLKYVLPCRYCRTNFIQNLKELKLTQTNLKNRCNFSKWMYKLHEHVNKMLGKKSGLKYSDIRERYEHFRSRCTINNTKIIKIKPKNKTRKKEKGCTKPLYGQNSKCIIKIVPKNKQVKSFQIDKKCIKKRKL